MMKFPHLAACQPTHLPVPCLCQLPYPVGSDLVSVFCWKESDAFVSMICSQEVELGWLLGFQVGVYDKLSLVAWGFPVGIMFDHLESWRARYCSS